MPLGDWTTAGLWLAVVGSGIYHGVNPGMGWPLAVSAGLMGNGRRDLVFALWPLTVGHFLAMSVVLLPFALLTFLLEWQNTIRIGAGLLVVAAGCYLLINRRHPRFLARIRPTQLALWSFAVAMAHGARLMLVPIYLGLCRVEELVQSRRCLGHQPHIRRRCRLSQHDIRILTPATSKQQICTQSGKVCRRRLFHRLLQMLALNKPGEPELTTGTNSDISVFVIQSGEARWFGLRSNPE